MSTATATAAAGTRPVRIVYFAWVRERVGLPEETLDIPADLATIAATQMQSGEFDRDVESSEGYTSEAPKN